MLEEQFDELVLLHKMMPGVRRSYGIEAASLACVPMSVVQLVLLVL